MKGFVSEIGWTIFLFLAVMTICFIAILGGNAIQFWHNIGGSKAASIDFVVANNGPFIVATSLSKLMIEDRQFVEHATEIMETENASNCHSEDIDVYLKKYFDYYDAKFMGVAIKNEKGDILFKTDNQPHKCGDDLSGYCVNSKRIQTNPVTGLHWPWPTYIGCTDGRVSIAAEKYTNPDNKCQNSNEICCVEGKDANGFWPENTVTCGTDSKDQIDLNDPGVCDYSGKCSNGRTEIQDKKMKCLTFAKNKDYVSMCCVPLKTETLIDIGMATTASAPLFYKNKIGSVEVTIA